jgi:hypothetical protein
VQRQDLRQVEVLLILPCNAAGCVGKYFRAEVYRKSGWNAWREADALLRDLRKEGRVAFAAVGSSILETAPDDPRAALSRLWFPKNWAALRFSPATPLVFRQEINKTA